MQNRVDDIGAVAQIHKEHDVSRNEIRQLGGIIRRTERTTNLLLSTRTSCYQPSEARRPALPIHDRLCWTIARASEGVFVGGVRTAANLIVPSRLHD